ncbi:hypothetical protein GXY_15549 [Novacetimonas hansenii ATCC 23769]|uniref:Uncharacterized protein n=1 Tax=Novacetimonas hansenii ATCC 23769 TaxID=714995 RepID=D5QIX8_NOVHA|nr:hypothetical protein GXY_15549 [Novacetimonas hansenii ATCC 23769]
MDTWLFLANFFRGACVRSGAGRSAGGHRMLRPLLEFSKTSHDPDLCGSIADQASCFVRPGNTQMDHWRVLTGLYGYYG